MRTRRITISATFAAGVAALPLSIAKAQYYPHQQQPTAKGTTDQLNREELARLQSGSGYSPYYWTAGSPWGWGWGYPACSSPFPLFWPFCVAGAVVGTAAMIVTAPVRALTGAPPYYYGYYGQPYAPYPNYPFPYPPPASAYSPAPSYTPQPSYAPRAGRSAGSTASGLNQQELNRLQAAPVNPPPPPYYPPPPRY
jgi:hypothetical protein